MEEIKKKQEELMAEVFESTKLSDKEKALISLTVSMLQTGRNIKMLAKKESCCSSERCC